VARAAADNVPLIAGDATLTPKRPSWMPPSLIPGETIPGETPNETGEEGKQ
jgi:hypothetical protein